MNPTHIAIIRSSFSPLIVNMYNVQEIGLAKGLLEYGVSTDIYSIFVGINQITVIATKERCSVKLIPIVGIKVFNRITYFPGLIKQILSNNYDLVQVHEDSELMTPLILRACKIMGVKTVLYQGMYQNYTGIKTIYQIIFDLIFKKGIQQHSDFIFSKTSLAKKYLETKGYKSVMVQPIGLNLFSKEVSSTLIDELKKFKMSHTKVLLYVGKIEKRRNPIFLVDLCRVLKDKNIGFVIVGEGPLEKKMLRLVQKNNLTDFFYFVSRVKNDEIGTFYCESDIFLLPTNYEIYGMVVLESLYYGTPVISTKTAGPIDILCNQNLGICIDLDADAWISAITKVLNTVVSRKMLNDHVLTNYNWEILANRYLKQVNFEDITDK